MENLPKTYNPHKVEDKWYQYWEEIGLFEAEIDYDKEPFSIVMPPPNITGQLHMGHALDNTLQDILTRWKRMSGNGTLWLPGTDHASIATEVKVVNQIREEGKEKQESKTEEEQEEKVESSGDESPEEESPEGEEKPKKEETDKSENEEEKSEEDILDF